MNPSDARPQTPPPPPDRRLGPALHPCPSCGVRPAGLARVPWGEGTHRLPVAPYLCEHCGEFGVIDLATGQIRAAPLETWEPVRQRNPALWQAMMRERARILARPN